MFPGPLVNGISKNDNDNFQLNHAIEEGLNKIGNRAREIGGGGEFKGFSLSYSVIYRRKKIIVTFHFNYDLEITNIEVNYPSLY